MLIASGVQVGDQHLQGFAALLVVPDPGVQRHSGGSRRFSVRRLFRHEANQGTGEATLLIQLHIRIVVIIHAIESDTPDPTLDRQERGISGDPFPAGIRMGGFQICGDSVIDMAQQGLCHIDRDICGIQL